MVFSYANVTHFIFLTHISGKILLASMRATLVLLFPGSIGLSMALMFLIPSSILSLLELICQYISPTLKSRTGLQPCMVQLKSCYLILSRLMNTCESISIAELLNFGYLLLHQSVSPLVIDLMINLITLPYHPCSNGSK